MKLNKLFLSCILILSVVGCKKIDPKDRRYYTEERPAQQSAERPMENSTILMKYANPSPISDIYIVCVEGQKIGISDTGSLVKLDFVSDRGIQSCN